MFQSWHRYDRSARFQIPEDWAGIASGVLLHSSWHSSCFEGRVWERIAKGGLDIHRVPADHKAIFGPQTRSGGRRELRACIHSAAGLSVCAGRSAGGRELSTKYFL
jgi:hypothetical protein